jgi:hypothetical protein
MYAIPNSSALDMAAAGGGPGFRVLPWIAGAEPGTVLGYAAELTQRVARLTAIVSGIEESCRALRQAWSSGSASDGAIQKVTATVQAFQRITTAVQALDGELQAVSATLTLVQQGYRAVVGATNPTVAALLSSPHTHAAARSLATSITTGLSSFVQTVRTALDQVGLVRMIAIVSTLVTIAGELEKLLSGDSPATPTPAAPTPTAPTPTAPTPAVPSPAVPCPTTPAPATGLTGYGSGGWTGYAARTPAREDLRWTSTT